MSSVAAGWLALVRERFSPSVYIPMILLFTAANGLFPATAQNLGWNTGRFFVVFVLMLSFFFRMRAFDEIKDYDTDLAVNPTRPLARGAIAVPQVKHGLFVLIVFELALAAGLGFWPFLVHALAIGYSLLMYEEFFLSDFLRPRLTTYAVSHTFVSVLLGFSAAVALTGLDPRSQLISSGFFFLSNWTFFNLFEFARKSFAPGEERENVESYSKLFGVRGAVALSLSQAVLGNFLLRQALENHPSSELLSRVSWPIAGLIVYTLAILPFFVRPTKPAARLFRAASGIYLLLHYTLVILLLVGA